MTHQASPQKVRLGSRRQASSAKKSRSFSDHRLAGEERVFVDHSYVDHSNDPVSDDDDKKSRPKGGVTVAFPEKLHTMLDWVELHGCENIVDWQPHGRCFLIREKDVFVKTIMPRFFQQTKLTSFQRQLNLYGFVRMTGKGPDRGAYYHPMFLQSRPDLCRRMMRTRVKGNGMKAAASPETEPNFYSMTNHGRIEKSPPRPLDLERTTQESVSEYTSTNIPIVTPILSSQWSHAQASVPVEFPSLVYRERDEIGYPRFPTLYPKPNAFASSNGIMALSDLLSPSPKYSEPEQEVDLDFFQYTDIGEGEAAYFEGHKFCFLNTEEDMEHLCS